MVSEKFITDISQFKQKKENDILDDILDDVLNGRINGNINKIIKERFYEILGAVILDDSDETDDDSSYEEVGLNEDTFHDMFSLSLAARYEELGNVMNSERWIEIYDVAFEELFNITNVEIRDKVFDVLTTETESGLLDEILFGLDFDCEDYRRRLKRIINELGLQT